MKAEERAWETKTKTNKADKKQSKHFQLSIPAKSKMPHQISALVLSSCGGVWRQLYQHRQVPLLWSQAGTGRQSCRECWHTRFPSRGNSAPPSCTHLRLWRREIDIFIIIRQCSISFVLMFLSITATTWHSYKMLCSMYKSQSNTPVSPIHLCPFRSIT